jgi:hypothetical protein
MTVLFVTVGFTAFLALTARFLKRAGHAARTAQIQ